MFGTSISIFFGLPLLGTFNFGLKNAGEQGGIKKLFLEKELIVTNYSFSTRKFP